MSSAIPVSVGKADSIRFMKLAILRRDRSIPHLGRRLYHLSMGLFCFALYAFVIDRIVALTLLSVIGGVWVLFDLFRLRLPTVNVAAMRLFGQVMRREELKALSGNSFFILGLWTTVAFFPKEIALLSCLFLALGDPVAATVGTLIGRRKILGKKTLEGALANLGCSAIAATLFLKFYCLLSFEKAILLGGVGGLVSMLAELCPLPINDNFTIPVVSALLLSLIAIFIPIVP